MNRTHPRRTLVTAALAACLLVPGVSASAAAPEPPAPAVDAPPPTGDAPLPTVAEITRRIDALYRSKSSHGEMTMEVVTKHYTRSLGMEVWTKGEDLALVVIRKPAREAGNASLKTDEGLWSYGKRSDRLLRIPTGLLGESWFGSHFTNDDLMHESSYEKDYDTTVARVVEDGTPLLVLHMVPKPDTAIVYTKVEYYLTPDEFLPVRVDYFDKDQVVRRMTFEDVKVLGGRRLPTVMRLVPSSAPNEHTILRYVDMTFDGSVPAGTFTPQGLRRATQR
ncbi:MAG: outer membrane lipoprotein-sorting protein [Deltaproteobacteria bacterium]|nr:MAG: outer membrane lipoprotein-sorting protein [Deltaproteobacteria bacterium]